MRTKRCVIVVLLLLFEGALAYGQLSDPAAIRKKMRRLLKTSRKAEIEQKATEAQILDESAPEGYIRIRRGMTREGERYNKGRALMNKAKKTGENEYVVDKCTVAIKRDGDKIYAACSGPDFTYRGVKGNFACKHIWAVCEKENYFAELKKK